MLHLVGKEGSENKCSEPHPHQGWNVVNKNMFLPIQIVGSFIKASHGRAHVCSVTGSVHQELGLKEEEGAVQINEP